MDGATSVTSLAASLSAGRFVRLNRGECGRRLACLTSAAVSASGGLPHTLAHIEPAAFIRFRPPARVRFAPVVRTTSSNPPVHSDICVFGCHTLLSRGASASAASTSALAAAALRIGAESGGGVASAFATLAGIQADRIELARENRAAGAAARASVAVLTILPIGGLFFAFSTGTLTELLALGRVGPILVAVGSVLLVSGAAATLALGRKLA